MKLKEEPIIEDLAEESILCKDLPEGESYLLRELKRLQDSSQEAIETQMHSANLKNICM